MVLASTLVVGFVAAVSGAAAGALVRVTHTLLLVSLLLSVAFRLGWVHRLMIWSFEREARRALNGTPVTVGSLRVDLLRGRAWASNVILHAPRRDAWKWKSPVQARVGNLYVECNLVLCLLSLWFLWEERPIDIATVEASDIQGFVERRNSVFNFYLLDPHIDVPDPVDENDDDDCDDAADDDGADEFQQVDDPNSASSATAALLAGPAADALSPRSVPGPTEASEGGGATHGGAGDGPSPQHVAAAEEEATRSAASTSAQKLVDDMVRALGRATQRGSFHAAFAESRERIKSELKALQKNKSKAGAMQEGVKIVQQVSKSIVEKSQNVPSVVFPTRRHGFKGKTVYGRIGRVVLRDLRVFTRDHHFGGKRSTTGPARPGGAGKGGDNIELDHDEDMDASAPIGSGAWNKPIWLERVTLRSAELCPPLSSKDADGLPMVYQPLDRCFEIVWKRVLTEIAKSNTGAFFQTAVGEVLDFYMDAKNPAAGTRDGGGAALLDHNS